VNDLLKQIHVALIDPDPNQPRQHFDGDALQALADSIKQYGQLQPVEVVPTDDGRYQLVHGERRWRACQLAGLPTVQAVVRNGGEIERTPLETFLVQYEENDKRQNLTVIEEARAFAAMLQMEHDGKPMSRVKLCALTGKHNQYVNGALAWLELPEEVQQLAAMRRLPLTHSVPQALNRLPTAELQIKFATKFAEKGATIKTIVQTVEAAIDRVLDQQIDDGETAVPAVALAFGLGAPPAHDVPLGWDSSIRFAANRTCSACQVAPVGVAEPGWHVFMESVGQTCKRCIQDQDGRRSAVTCRQCPLPQMLRKLHFMMEVPG
jgi:ParB family chromosome partitioning protein